MPSSDSPFAANRRDPAGDMPLRGPTTTDRLSTELDVAIDHALRDVPLPEGLLTRLGEMVYSVSDAPADRLDWLGC